MTFEYEVEEYYGIRDVEYDVDDIKKIKDGLIDIFKIKYFKGNENMCDKMFKDFEVEDIYSLAETYYEDLKNYFYDDFCREMRYNDD